MKEISKILDKKVFYTKADEAFGFIDKIGFPKKRILLVSDEKIWKNCQKFFGKNFLKNITKTLILKDPYADEKQLTKILKTCTSLKENVILGRSASEDLVRLDSEAKLPRSSTLRVKDDGLNFDLIIAVGSGTINDLCKLSSARLQIPYVIFPSALSMNGYLSQNASIKISGHKKTLPATLPLAVFCDVRILASAPQVLTKAGVGDMMCFYSCWFDWYLSHRILGTEFDEKPFRILEKKMEFFLKNFQKFSLKDQKFLEILCEILLLSGLGMTMAGGSYPASQSEHLIAHCLDMKFHKKLQKILHGSQIAVTTLTSSQLQKKLLSLKGLRLQEIEFPQKNLKKFFGKNVAAECEKEFMQKNPSGSKLLRINALLQNEWKDIREYLQKIYLDEAVLRQIFSHFKIKTSYKSLGVSHQEYQDCTARAKFIRNRFTCLDLGAAI